MIHDICEITNLQNFFLSQKKVIARKRFENFSLLAFEDSCHIKFYVIIFLVSEMLFVLSVRLESRAVHSYLKSLAGYLCLQSGHTVVIITIPIFFKISISIIQK